ncbi:MAG: hypothetical protein E7463_10035 [Ruminococcaceae bacterium]|nr:hypothetical protein [Oscillospiraceae bacterium]
MDTLTLQSKPEKPDTAICRQRREANAIGSVWFLTLGAALLLLGELSFLLAQQMHGIAAYAKRLIYYKHGGLV